jgi:hypothetical protein
MKKLIVAGIVVLIVWLTVRFPFAMINPGDLTAGHQDLNQKCLSCHQPFRGIPNGKCIACHKLSEIGKDSLHPNDTNAINRKILFHQGLETQLCTSCHTDHKGIEPGPAISRFSHELIAETIISNCTGCHNQPPDTLHSKLSTACMNCHNTKSWKLSVAFNHDMIQAVGKENCTSCHAKPNDAYHTLITDNCNKCHTTVKWVPSTFDHSAYFRLDENHNAKCNTCHTTTDFKIYTCYNCHEHAENEMIQKHNEEGIYNITNCASCHKSGDEHEIERRGNTEKERNNVNEYIKQRDKKDEKEKDDD